MLQFKISLGLLWILTLSSLAEIDQVLEKAVVEPTAASALKIEASVPKRR